MTDRDEDEAACLGHTTTVDVDTGNPARVLVVPLGSTEQHGPHLPLSTDTDIAVALCRGLAERRSDVVVAPPIPYGASGEHAGFAGTLSIGAAALELIIVELVRSATETFRRVLVVSAHGGNSVALARSTQTLLAEGRDVAVYSPQWTGDLHAGHSETSLMLAIRPDLVRTDRLAVGNTGSLSELWPAMRAHGVRAVSENGVLGDPTTATAAAGTDLLARLVDDLVAAVSAWFSELAGVSQ